MNLVVDTNILFSFFWQDSLTRKLLITSNFNLISPEVTLEEIKKYSKEICNKLKISENKFKEQLKKLKEIASFVNREKYSEFLKEAEKIAPDKNDAEFLALCLKYSCFLWSNDSILKNQKKIKVLSTEEIIEILF